MSTISWKTLETKYLHPGIRLDSCQLPDGQTIQAHILEYDDEIMVLPLTKNEEVVLIRQYRHGVQKAILEMPGGSVDRNERPLEAAKRELLEETGYTADKFIEVGSGSPNPAIYTNRIHYFLALDVEQTGKQSHSNSEPIEVMLLPFEEVIQMAKTGNLTHSLNLSLLFFVLGYLHRIS